MQNGITMPCGTEWDQYTCMRHVHMHILPDRRTSIVSVSSPLHTHSDDGELEYKCDSFHQYARSELLELMRDVYATRVKGHHGCHFDSLDALLPHGVAQVTE